MEKVMHRIGDLGADEAAGNPRDSPVLVCGVGLLCDGDLAWGFGFYGQSVYLSELHRAQGWPSFWIAAATTTFYLAGALLVTKVHMVIDRLGPRTVLIGGAAGVRGRPVLPFRNAVAALPCGRRHGVRLGMHHDGCYFHKVALWFDRQRGLAIGLALNGASVAGFTVTPALIALSRRHGLSAAVGGTALALLAVLVPLVIVGIGPRSPDHDRPATSRTVPDRRPVFQRSSEALRDWRFWSVALPFGLVLAAQVGFIVHLVALLLPRLGPDGAASAVSAAAMAAILGRVGLSFVIDRLDQRRISAASFATQAIGLGLIVAFPARPELLYAACCLFGLSVGNVNTLPSLIIQREFAARSFGLVDSAPALARSLGPAAWHCSDSYAMSLATTHPPSSSASGSSWPPLRLSCCVDRDGGK